MWEENFQAIKILFVRIICFVVCLPDTVMDAPTIGVSGNMHGRSLRTFSVLGKPSLPKTTEKSRNCQF